MSNSEKMLRKHFNRRSLLKSVAAGGAMATITDAHSGVAQTASKNKAATKSWRDKPVPLDETLIENGGIYDVIVVGGGHAGLLCARVAAMKGASVAVIENQAEKDYVCGIGGGQVGTINSQYALDHGAPRIDEGDFLREWARRNVIRHNPKRASYFVKNSGKVLDWILSYADKELLVKKTHMMSCPPEPTVLLEVSGFRFYYGTAMFGVEAWREILKIHHQKAMTDGAKWFFDHHAEICDANGSGAVTGVIAKRSDEKYVRFTARKGVALCAGDFSGNREMVIDILDDLRHQAEAQGNLNLVKASGGMGSVRDGTGIKMGVWAGGHVEIGPRSTMGSGDPGQGGWFLQLNHNGERFCDEAVGTTLAQPIGSVRVTLYDANWRKALEMMPPNHLGPDTADTRTWPARLKHLDNIKPGPPSKNQQKPDIDTGLPNVTGTTCCGNTIDELLDYMDCYKGETRKKALAEIARYNEMCEKSVDEDFGKDPRIMKATSLKVPPFFGTMSIYDAKGMFGGISPGILATTGLDTDADGRVLNSEFKPIPGLYAAGNNAGGRFIIVYQCPFAGISIGMAITDGYLLGERLAAL
jgi:fumarate reductase flavoprotein subunit